jgi:dihydrofolate reductase
MRKLVMALNISLDGFANHEMGIADGELHDFFTRELEKTGLLLFGRVTYQLMESYWPHVHDDPDADRSTIEFGGKFNSLPKIVFSQSLQKADWQNSKIVRTDAIEEIKKLKQTDGKNISVGGISLIQACMRHDLIDAYTILIHPVIWGKGKRLFENVEIRQNLVLTGTMTFRSGVVVMRYSRLTPV